MQNVGDIIQNLARQRSRGDTSPLILLRQFDSTSGKRVSHLPIDGELAPAWIALTGAPFRPHQAQALTALRRGDPLALHASSPDVVMTVYLLMYTTLLTAPYSTALVLAPDASAAELTYSQIATLNSNLPYNLRLTATLIEPGQRFDSYARIVVVPPETLHHRLLRHHDRSWSLFWPRLQLVALPDLHCYPGVAGAHLADLLLRTQRIAAIHTGGHVPNILATLFESNDPEPWLTKLLGQPWRIIAADDGPHGATTFGVWHSAAARVRDSAEIASALQHEGYRVHILCQPLESALITPITGDVPEITIGPQALPANVLIANGYPGSHSALRRLLQAGYQAVIMVLGDLPHEHELKLHITTLLADPPTSWPTPSANAYVTAQHVLCAASEQPLTEPEIEVWGAQSIIARLVAHDQLVDLPDPEVAWKPTEAVGDPYVDFSLLSSSGGAIVACNEQATIIGQLDPTGFERWTFPNAALPVGTGGFRVLSRDEEGGTVTLRIESPGRRTYPLRRCEISVRETRETRRLHGATALGWGRVVVDEEIYGYREMSPGGVPAEQSLHQPLTARWIAPACWFDLAGELQMAGQFVGWSLAAALPLRALASMTDVVPCYDREKRRLYLVDAQPGGNGLAAWTYAHAEELLPLAYDVALACRNDPLLEPLSRVDMDWLLTLLGHSKELPTKAPSSLVAAKPHAPVAAQEFKKPAPAPPAPPPPARTPAIQAADPSVPKRVRPEAEKHPPKPPSRSAPLPEETRRPASARPEQQREPRRPTPIQSPARVRPAPTPIAPSPRPRQAPQPAQPEEKPANAAALIERLRRERQQREAKQEREGRRSGRNNSRNVSAKQPETSSRFLDGDRIFCLPYGDGIVQSCYIENGRELLVVIFPAHGELTIDPTVSLVRKLDDAPQTDDLF